MKIAIRGFRVMRLAIRGHSGETKFFEEIIDADATYLSPFIELAREVRGQFLRQFLTEGIIKPQLNRIPPDGSTRFIEVEIIEDQNNPMRFFRFAVEFWRPNLPEDFERRFAEKFGRPSGLVPKWIVFPIDGL